MPKINSRTWMWIIIGILVLVFIWFIAKKPSSSSSNPSSPTPNAQTPSNPTGGEVQPGWAVQLPSGPIYVDPNAYWDPNSTWGNGGAVQSPAGGLQYL